MSVDPTVGVEVPPLVAAQLRIEALDAKVKRLEEDVVYWRYLALKGKSWSYFGTLQQIEKIAGENVALRIAAKARARSPIVTP